jgi:YggT family protein
MQLLYNFVGIFFDLLSFAIIARILLSWMQNQNTGRIKMVLHDITEPVLAPFRRSIFRIGMIDLSPIVALFVLDLVKSAMLYLVSYIYSII